MCLSQAPGQAELTFSAQKGSQAGRVRCFPLSVGKGAEWRLSPLPPNLCPRQGGVGGGWGGGYEEGTWALVSGQLSNPTPITCYVCDLDSFVISLNLSFLIFRMGVIAFFLLPPQGCDKA